MRISFFEEFPTANNLRKISMVGWPSTIYLAAHNLQEYQCIISGLRPSPKIKFVYWPVLREEEGYWISPWTVEKALQRILHEIENRKENQPLTVMLDLELPKRRRNLLRMTRVWKNRRRIRSFIEKAPKFNVEIILVEMPELFRPW